MLVLVVVNVVVVEVLVVDVVVVDVDVFAVVVELFGEQTVYPVFPFLKKFSMIF